MLSSRKNSRKFDDDLIGLVKTHPVLYVPNYSKTRKYLTAYTRQQAWAEIGEYLNRTADECRKRWKVIRDKYVRGITVDRTGSMKRKLCFLDDHVKVIKKSKKNPENSNGNTLVTLDMVQSLVKEKTDNDSNNDALIEVTSDFLLNAMFEKSIEETIHKFTEPNSSVQPSQLSTLQHPDEEVRAETVDSIARNSSCIHISNVISLAPEAESSVTNDVAKSKRDKKCNLNESDKVDIVIPKSKVARTVFADTANQQVHIPTFFKEIGEYIVTRFPIQKQRELRLKVLSIVTEMELELLHADDQ